METRFRKEYGRTFPREAAKPQVDSIEGVAELGDEQKEILYKLATALISLEDIGIPNDRRLGWENDGQTSLRLVREAIQNSVPAEIIVALLDRDSLTRAKRKRTKRSLDFLIFGLVWPQILPDNQKRRGVED